MNLCPAKMAEVNSGLVASGEKGDVVVAEYCVQVGGSATDNWWDV